MIDDGENYLAIISATIDDDVGRYQQVALVSAPVSIALFSLLTVVWGKVIFSVVTVCLSTGIGHMGPPVPLHEHLGLQPIGKRVVSLQLKGILVL